VASPGSPDNSVAFLLLKTGRHRHAVYVYCEKWQICQMLPENWYGKNVTAGMGSDAFG